MFFNTKFTQRTQKHEEFTKCSLVFLVCLVVVF
jgi:hypothetical protein